MLLGVIAYRNRPKSKRHHRWWIREMHRQREQHETFYHLVRKLKLSEEVSILTCLLSLSEACFLYKVHPVSVHVRAISLIRWTSLTQTWTYRIYTISLESTKLQTRRWTLVAHHGTMEFQPSSPVQICLLFDDLIFFLPSFCWFFLLALFQGLHYFKLILLII
jgi:hypothetical protein